MHKKKKRAPVTLIAAIITAVSVIVAAIISRQQTVIVLAEAHATGTVAAGRASQAVEILRNTIEAPTITPPPSQTLYTTYTPLPLPTNSPTSQPTESVAPEIQSAGYVFFDDFEAGIAPEWKVQYGQVGMFDGKLTVIDPSRAPYAYHYIILDTLYWKDMTIEIDLAPFNGAFYGGEPDSIGAIVLHQAKDAPSVGLRFYTGRDGLQFGTLSADGEWYLPTELVDGFGNDFTLHDRNHTIKVVAEGLS